MPNVYSPLLLTLSSPLPSFSHTACSKALKKHDKTVGLDTRARFMRNVVNQQPFTHYPRLLEMLQEMEETFKEIDAVQGASARYVYVYIYVCTKYTSTRIQTYTYTHTHAYIHTGRWRMRSDSSWRPFAA
jgi:hypothetical protein